MPEPRYFDPEKLRTFLEGKAEEQFIVDQFFEDLGEEGLESAVLRVRAFERIGLYILGTYEDLCSFIGLPPEESHDHIPESEAEHCKCSDLVIIEDLLIRTRGAPKVKL